MNIQIKYKNSYLLYLLIGIVSYCIIGADVLLKLYPTGIFQIGLSNVWHDVFLAWFFVGHLLFLKIFFEEIEIFNVQILLQYILIFGLAIVTIYFASNLLINTNYLSTSPVLRNTVYLFNCYFLIIYFFVALILFKKLFDIKKTRNDILLWNVFLLVIFISILFNFTSIKFPNSVIYVYLSLGLILILFVAVRLRWIALLQRNEKWMIIFSLLLISSVSLILSRQLFDDSELYIVNINFFRNVFLILLNASVIIFTIFSLLALIFNLPIASVMEERTAEMNSFQEINQIIQGKFRKEEIIKKLFAVSYANTKAEAGWIWIQDAQYNYQFNDNSNVEEKVILLMNNILKIFESSSKQYDQIYVSNMLKDASFKDIQSGFKSFVYFPIVVNKRLIGKIVLLKTFINGFDEYMIRLIKTYVEQTQLALEKASLIEETLETERLKEELEIAKSVQQRLLPYNMPKNKHFEIAYFNESALEVGGDYYDFYQIDKDRHVLIIADVSGKGVTAAFHMAEMKGIFEALIQMDLSPQQFIVNVNTALSNCLEKNFFITLSYFYIDSKKKRLSYYRAGHCPTLYYDSQKDKVDYLDDEGLALGIIRDDSFVQYVTVKDVTYNTNDFIVLYTDGVIEAKHNKTKQDYGYNRLKQCADKYKALSASEIKEKLLEDLSMYTHNVLNFDDVSLIVLKFK